ncbi:MAG: hypothetical protein QM582_16365 [Micropruina sp.]|uniref:hypothetical protein n=1 Tax=Micropruina sp. TaxID=2737536 RepID=UPI0039E674FB
MVLNALGIVRGTMMTSKEFPNSRYMSVGVALAIRLVIFVVMGAMAIMILQLPVMPVVMGVLSLVLLSVVIGWVEMRWPHRTGLKAVVSTCGVFAVLITSVFLDGHLNVGCFVVGAVVAIVLLTSLRGKS